MLNTKNIGTYIYIYIIRKGIDKTIYFCSWYFNFILAILFDYYFSLNIIIITSLIKKKQKNTIRYKIRIINLTYYDYTR